MKNKVFCTFLLFLCCSIVYSADNPYNNDSIIDISSLDEIPNALCYSRDDIKKVIFCDSLKEIGRSVFENCYNLEDIVIPDGCESILDDAFNGCVSLNTIQIPSSVSYFGTRAIQQDAVMIVEKHSKAEEYAKENNIDYVYSRDEIIATNVIGPILKTCWNQPIDYFYGIITVDYYNNSEEPHYFITKGKYDVQDNDQGLCLCIAFGQIFKHLNINIYGSQRYSNYYKDMDSDRVNIDSLPRYINYINPGADRDVPWVLEKITKDSIFNDNLCRYIENVAFAMKMEWRTSESPMDFGDMEKHIPAHFKSYPITAKNKTKIESLIRDNLKNDRPLYAGISFDIGHAVVIDGIRTRKRKTEVHVDFGWGGSYNMWIALDAPINVYKIHGGFFEKIIEVIPLSGDELKEWKPFRSNK